MRMHLAERMELGDQFARGGVTGPAGSADQLDQVIDLGCSTSRRGGTAGVRRPAANRVALMEELARGDGPPAVDLADHRRKRDFDVLQELLAELAATIHLPDAS